MIRSTKDAKDYWNKRFLFYLIVSHLASKPEIWRTFVDNESQQQ